jgi:hypothetical protein
MLNWLKKASGNAQRENVRRTLARLIDSADVVSARIDRDGYVSPADQRKVTSIQQTLYNDLIGPVPIDDLKQEFLEPVLADPTISGATKVAVNHVFSSFEQHDQELASKP